MKRIFIGIVWVVALLHFSSVFGQDLNTVTLIGGLLNGVNVDA